MGYKIYMNMLKLQGMKTKLWYLKNLDMFSHLRDEEMHHVIEKTSSMREIKRGEILYLQGTSDKNIYIHKKGAVKINKLSAEGKAITLDILKGGTLLGELGTIDESDRDETAEVIEDGLICIMSKSHFEELLKMVPGLAIRLNKIIGLRRRKLENKLIDLLYCTVEERLAKTLINLLDDFGVPDDGSYLLKIKLTHHDLSELIASTRETTTATLNHLKKEGLIDYAGKYIKIINKDGLEAIGQPSLPR
jgi:CRP-like cAMP-binding protein